MKYIKHFEEWTGTIKVGENEIDKLWRYSAKMSERFFNYIQKEISPVKCYLEGNSINIEYPYKEIGSTPFKDILVSAKMSTGSNMFRTVDISKITIWLSFGPGPTGNYYSEDGYYNTTIYIQQKLFDRVGEYRFTSETIEDLCEFLNKIFKEGLIEFNEPDK